LTLCFFFVKRCTGALVIGLACSVLGVYVVLRRIVFGRCRAGRALVGGHRTRIVAGGTRMDARASPPIPIALALILTIAGVLFFGAGGGRGRIPPDATIGVTYAVAAAMGIILISKAKTGEAHDIFLQGNILVSPRRHDVLIAVAVPVLLVHAIFYKEVPVRLVRP